MCTCLQSDTMAHPPRNPKTERLVNRRLISFSYFQIGVLQVSTRPWFAVPGFETLKRRFKDTLSCQSVHLERPVHL